MKKLFVFLLFAFVANAGYSQMIWGKVYDLEDVMLDSVLIDMTYERAYTNESGQFTAMVRPEQTIITITKKGFKPVEQKINVEAGFDYMLRVLMVPEKADKKTLSACFLTVKRQ